MPSRYPFLTRAAAKVEAHLSTHGVTDLFLVTYTTSVFLTFLWGFWTEYVKPKNSGFEWYIGLARGAGYSLNLNTALVILLASRLFITALRDTALADVLPLDKAFPALHIVVAYVTIFSVAIHVPFHLVWIVGWKKWRWGLWQVNMTVITGFVLLAIFAAMVVFALPFMRKTHFRLFYIIHLVGAALFFVVLIFHGMYEAKPETYKWVTAPLIIYILDRIVRVFRSSEHCVELSATNSSFKDENVLQLSIPKPFNFRPGQYAEIKVPAINQEWHPFTIASAEYESNMSFYIKLLGDWTKSLHTAFQARIAGETTLPLELFVRGPFGAPTQHVGKYSRIILISGGIGATPFVSICKQLNHLHEEHDKQVHSRHLPRQNEAIINGDAELRIRQAVKNIYDVDMDVLDLECTAGNHERESVATQRMEYVAEMLRVTSGDGAHAPTTTSQNNQVAEAESKVANEIESERQSVESQRRSVDTNQSGSDESSSGVDESRSIKSFKKNVKKALNSIRIELGSPGIITEEEKWERQRQARLGEWRSNLLLVLHSSRVTFLLAVICVARMAVTICGSIFKSGFLYLDEPVANARWLPLVYSILSTPLTMLTTLTVLVEVNLHLGAAFGSTRRLLEVVMFGPVAFVLTALEYRRWATNDPGGAVLIFIQYILSQSVTFVLIVGRMWRAVGRYGLLDDRHRPVHDHSPDHIPNADFVWTVSNDASDAWVRREMVPVTLGGAVTCHRYITKGSNRDSLGDGIGIEDMEEGQRVSVALDEATKSGRPNWDQLLGAAARNTRSDGVVGIFFCGPKKMGDTVRETAKKAEIWSSLRDAYLRSVNVGTLMRDIGLSDESEVLRLRDFGCRVRFVYHEENFS